MPSEDLVAGHGKARPLALWFG